MSRPRGRVPQGERTAAVVVAGFGTIAPDDRVTVGVVAEAGSPANWQLLGDGEGIHWPDADEDVSVEDLECGRPGGPPLAAPP